MRIVLKKDWDIPIHPPTDGSLSLGHFAGRARELNMLTNEILRKNTGSILISGYCGVGKTSLVYKALSDARAQDKDIIIVLLNAAQLDAELTKDQIDLRMIIENLIRRLYSITRNLSDLPNIKEDINTLYRKAAAAEFKQLHAKQLSQEITEETIEHEAALFGFTFENLRNFILGIWLLIIVTFQFTTLPHWFKIIALLSSIPSPFAATFTSKKFFSLRQKDIKKVEAKEFYKFDGSVGNLEFDLEEIHRKISTQKKKLIYVIDELDKLTPEQVTQIIKFFKNLFTLSDALFIFVGGQEIYNRCSKSSPKFANRQQEYTYFTSKYFLSRPLWLDLSTYLENIIEEHTLDENQLATFKRAICFEANNDFFDIKTFIKDRITDFDPSGKPRIELPDITPDNVQKARFHKATVLFEERYMSSRHSKWEENEHLHELFFSHAKNLYQGYPGLEINDPDKEDLDSQAIRDFNGFLYRLKLLSSPKEITSKPFKGLTLKIKKYKLGGEIPAEPPDRLDSLTEFERQYINTFDIYCEYLVSLLNSYQSSLGKSHVLATTLLESPKQFAPMFQKWGFDPESVLRNHSSYCNALKSTPPDVYERETLEKYTEEITSRTKDFVNTLPSIVSNMLVQIYSNIVLKRQNLRDNNNLFSGSAIEIRNSFLNVSHFTVCTPDLSRQLLFFGNNTDLIFKIKTIVKDNSKTHNLICFTDKMQKLTVKGLHIVDNTSPIELQNSLSAFLKKIDRFFSQS